MADDHTTRLLQLRIRNPLHAQLQVLAERESNRIAPVVRRLISEALAREFAEHSEQQDTIDSRE